ncbi:MAG TPA: 5'/3'-nucleotidase SurE [Microthrixaceae bacterium]|nr:5'/3'-nucleotidase SurE [Microthrixaceae bacterium]
MRILVTNDDGLHAPGLLALATALDAAGHEVLAVAPHGDRSGSGAAIGNLVDGSYVRYREMPLAGLDRVHSIELDGPPALCVFAACLGAFGDPPELVASGLNPGLNTGRLTLHSGTVGAALTAANLGLSAVATSIAGREHSIEHWDTGGQLTVQVVEWLASAEPATVVNLSLPDVPAEELREARFGTLAPFGNIRAEITGRTEERLEFALVHTDEVLPPGSDAVLVAQGHPVVTALTGIRGHEPPGLVDHLHARSS